MSATVGIRTRVASLEGLNPNQLDYGCNKRMYLSGLYNVYWTDCPAVSRSFREGSEDSDYVEILHYINPIARVMLDVCSYCSSLVYYR